MSQYLLLFIYLLCYLFFHSSRPTKIPRGLIFPTPVSLVDFSFFITFHFISFLVFYCIVLLYSVGLLFLLSFLIFSLLATSSVNLNLNLFTIYTTTRRPTFVVGGGEVAIEPNDLPTSRVISLSALYSWSTHWLAIHSTATHAKLPYICRWTV